MNSPIFAQRTSGNSAKAPAEPYAACGAAHGLSLPFGNSRLWPSTELYYANFSRTWAPAAASADAVARPIPREAPVTKAVLLRRAAIFFYLRFRRQVPSRHVPPSSRVQKQRRVFNEELRVLVVRAVIGVGIDDQLRIRHVLLHDERVHRGQVHVVTAVHD